MNLPLEGVFHNIAVISIDKRYRGMREKLWRSAGNEELSFTKAIVVVDKWVDVNLLGSMENGNNVDPKRDTVVIEGP